jgi:hypothetical protein
MLPIWQPPPWRELWRPTLFCQAGRLFVFTFLFLLVISCAINRLK